MPDSNEINAKLTRYIDFGGSEYEIEYPFVFCWVNGEPQICSREFWIIKGEPVTIELQNHLDATEPSTEDLIEAIYKEN